MPTTPLPLAAMFDFGGEPSPDFIYTHYAFLIFGLVIMPTIYGLLYCRMEAVSIPNPPNIPYFCVCGSIGGYFIIAGLSPSVFTWLSLPFFPLALLSLFGSVIYLMRCRPFTGYHLGAAICCGIPVALMSLLLGSRWFS